MFVDSAEFSLLNFYRASELHGGLILGQMVRRTRDPELILQLTRHSAEEVMHALLWTETIVAVVIEDDGPGFAPDVVMRLGEPYVTRKVNRRAKSEDGSGLGLGLFIAKTLLERTGASVSMTNAAPPLCGARVTILWQRSNFERGRAFASLFGPADHAAPAVHDHFAEKVDGNG